ncbi:MAG TPA: hypothetical protein VGQ33_00035 [Vicinamibacteria bacterium]|nr:hypothetical protein [Vicinamibacteria bacterium]
MLAHAPRIAAVLILVGGAAALATSAPLASTPGARPPALERMKSLAGDWVSLEDGPMTKKGDVVAHYAVTGAGSAVVETVFPGTDHEMLTVYHADGADLVLTHYCMEGNQPRMRARAPQGSRFDFAFDGGTNIDPAKDRHMHSATLELLGADEIRSEWTETALGAPVFVARTHLARQTR